MSSRILVGKAFPERVIPLINAAKRNIDIAVYDWRWYQDRPGSSVQKFNVALAQAVRRGVIVRAITNNADAIEPLKKIGVYATKYAQKRILHAKLIFIDEHKLISGSHNFTERAFSNNIEVSTIQDLVADEDITRMIIFFRNIMPL